MHHSSGFNKGLRSASVKDYIMCSRSLMCGVSDYRVFTNICHGNNDHHLLAVTLQLRLRVLPRPGASRGVWDAAVLWDRPQATADFCSLLRN